MQNLWNKTQNKKVVENVIEAKTFYERAKGLLGKKDLDPQTAMWIHRCNNIHTFFMNFEIDAVFVDKKLKVRKVHNQVKPWKIIFPVWSANSVFELKSGVAQATGINVGDQLHVGN